MTPKTFKPHADTDRRYLLTYNGGVEDVVIDVHLKEDVLTFGYPYSHGSSLRIGRIEEESAEHIAFTTVDPPVELFEGVVTLRDTGESHQWT